MPRIIPSPGHGRTVVEDGSGTFLLYVFNQFQEARGPLTLIHAIASSC